MCQRLATLFPHRLRGLLSGSLVLLVSALLAGRASAANPSPLILSVPPSDGVLQVTVPLPSSLVLDIAKQWRLSEIPRKGTQPAPSSPLDLVPGQSEDGTPSRSAQVLITSIPPRPSGAGLRQLEVTEAAAANAPLAPAFRFDQIDGKTLGLWEGSRPVFVYNFGVQSRVNVPADRDRSTYLHPIYGLDGEVLTDDFPADHLHHRGLFWAWPHVRIEGTNYDLWDLRGIHQRFERWLGQRAGSVSAVLGVENGWYIGDKKVVQERAWFTVYPASGDHQAIDAAFTWIPLAQPITLSGAEEKSYGGFTLRFAPRTNTVITTSAGRSAEDLAMTRLTWADLSAQFANANGPSGAAIFIHGEHPDFPPTWLTRHYGALCVGWPGVTPTTFQPGERIHCRYRIWIHRRILEPGDLAHAYELYEAASKIRCQPPSSP